ncbi:Cell growth-regulating nucleolar protein [Seminavis robusta]|uniref:Cell growth-regulating nucleolar protein n=1 Tax=Seminavis robusta TaxID=568900 RepID=A0A9N8HDW7_9STRA|nr:Cell growth-regulating nucleolar protein [Seminavis robusta]|eukprot:Sro361_g126460.1 Cell growth-regulating nucleolar protein (286) ;mRNA; f:20473-21602
MVFFTCDGCGETLKKSQVDGHANRCRRCDSVSCVDCSICFYGDDYRSHTSCSMTEVDNLVASRGGNNKSKKLSPQEAWMELLNSSVSTAPPSIQWHLQQMVQLDNVPRKEKQFRNFAINSLNLRGNSAQKILDCIWSHLNEQRELQKQQKEQLQKKKEETKQPQQSSDSTATPSTSDETKSDDVSNSVSDTEDQSSSNNNNNKDDNNNKEESGNDDKAMYKNVKKATKKLLKKAPNRSMKFKSLQKALREQMGTTDKEKLKMVMKQVMAKETKKFLLEGKQIRLV